MSGIVTLQSGQPFGIVGGNGNNNSGSLQFGDRADIVPGVPLNIRQGSKAQWLTHYLNPAAFVANAPGTFGDSGKNMLRGPGIDSSDLAFVKNWKVQERY